MQLYALDQDNRIIPAALAKKQQDYICAECQSPVRIRSGQHRQAHYFHLASSTGCRQHEKSMMHIATQNYLYHLLPDHDRALEYRFPEIQRIADLVWFSKKIIFEVQCSYIDAEELLARNRDYASQGYQVVWIFHDQRYNHYLVTQAEQTLKTPFYYTNITATGEGIVYDQFSLIRNGIRIKKFAPLSIDPSTVKSIENRNSKLTLVQERIKQWPFHFANDLIDRFEEHELEYALAERELMKHSNSPFQFLIKPYKLVFQFILEGFCKG